MRSVVTGSSSTVMSVPGTTRVVPAIFTDQPSVSTVVSTSSPVGVDTSGDVVDGVWSPVPMSLPFPPPPEGTVDVPASPVVVVGVAGGITDTGVGDVDDDDEHDTTTNNEAMNSHIFPIGVTVRGEPRTATTHH